MAARDSSRILYVGSEGDGFLGGASLKVRRFFYRRRGNRWLTLLAYLRSQWDLWRSLRQAVDIDPDALLYVNTLLPFAAAVYGRCSGRRVICHLHEVALRPRLLHFLLLKIANWSAYRVICVSQFHRKKLGLARAIVVMNAVDPAMFDVGLRNVYAHRREGRFRVCMVCSLRDYKGVPEFFSLSQDFSNESDIEFELVVSDDDDTLRHYCASRVVPSNLCIRNAVHDTSQVYARASLVMNLSRVDLCEETFGLTLLEAMTFGVPVIAPPSGGPVEFVDNGVHGYLVDSRDRMSLRGAVEKLAQNEVLCQQMSRKCRERARLMSPEVFQADIRQAVFEI